MHWLLKLGVKFNMSGYDDVDLRNFGGQKKKLCILVILIAVLLVGTVGCYFMPKKFGKNVNPSEVDLSLIHI